MAYCYKNGKRMKVTSSLLTPTSKVISSRGYSPQMKPYKQKVDTQSMYSKDMIKCFLAIFVILFIIFY